VSRTRTASLALVASFVLAGVAPAQSGPDKIRLPDDFRPEGIASGRSDTFYVGSIPTGAVYRGSYRRQGGRIVVPASPGRQAIGLKWSRDVLWVAGGPTGDGYAYNARNGRSLKRFVFVPEGQQTFVNDVVLTKRAAYFTDSRRPFVYRVRRADNGRPRAVTPIALTGIEYVTGNNLNGIVAARGGRVLIAVQSVTGKLWNIDSRTGRAREISLGGTTLNNGDGLLLRGRTLYVVRNRDNLIAEVRLAENLRRGTVRRTLTDSDLDVPTTIALRAGDLYAVNARFGAMGTGLRYDVVRVER
jgi:hypothetical protein